MKLILSSLFFLVSVASALVLDTPTGWHSGEAVTERWQTQRGDPAQFNLELASAQNNGNGNGNQEVAHNVRTANGAVSFRLPNVAPGRYVLRAVGNPNDNNVYAQSEQFNIAK